MYDDIGEMLQVGEIALFKADDPVHFFYLSYVTKEQEIIKEIFKDDYRHKYYPGSKIIRGKYLEIFKEEKVTTKYYLDQQEAAVLSYSAIGICPELMAVNFYMRKKLVSGYLMENTLKESLKEVSSI